MADSLGVGFRYEEIYEMCQAAVSQEKEKNIKDQKDSKVEMVGTRQRKRFKNSFKTSPFLPRLVFVKRSFTCLLQKMHGIFLFRLVGCKIKPGFY